LQKDKGVVYLHLVWTTWDRLPLIEPEQENALFDCLANTATKHGCQIVAINGMADHVHFLLSIPPTQAVSSLVQQIKGVSSHFMNHQFPDSPTFKWRGSYAAFSISRWDVHKVAQYIRNQKAHHTDNSTIDQLESDE
jgi:REP element-mobilizing transposase RayT